MMRSVVDLSGPYGIPALEAVLSACSTLTIFHKDVDFHTVKEALKIFAA